jgi:hypothetical protein
LKESFVPLVNFYLTCAGFASSRASTGSATSLFCLAN